SADRSSLPASPRLRDSAAAGKRPAVWSLLLRAGSAHGTDQAVPEGVGNVEFGSVISTFPGTAHPHHFHLHGSLAGGLLQPVRYRRFQIDRARPCELPLDRLVAQAFNEPEQRLPYVDIVGGMPIEKRNEVDGEHNRSTVRAPQLGDAKRGGA